MTDERERTLARRTRRVAIVIAATMALWIAVQIVGARLDLAPRYAFLADLAALAAFGWALAAGVQVWRRRQDD